MNIYTEEIIDNYKNPQHKGRLRDYSVKEKLLNPYCGDEIELYLKLNSRGKLVNASFDGHGCAVSIAGASILLTNVINKNKKMLTKLTEQDMLNLLGIQISAARKKCALLAYAVLKECLIK